MALDTSHRIQIAVSMPDDSRSSSPKLSNSHIETEFVRKPPVPPKPSIVNKPPVSKRREELTKAISDARKKIQTLGWKSGGLSNSKSVANLKDVPNDLVTRTINGDNNLDSIRRSVSLTDLLFIPQRKLLPPSFTPNVEMADSPLDSSTTIWDQTRENGSIMRRSSTNLNRSESITTHSVHFKNNGFKNHGLWASSSLHSLNKINHLPGRTSAPIHHVHKEKTTNCSNSYSSDEDSSYSDEINLVPARPGTPPKPSTIKQHRRQSANSKKIEERDTSIPNFSSQTSLSRPPRRKWAIDLRTSKSEYNLSNIGRETPSGAFRFRNLRSSSNLFGSNSILMQNDKIDLSMTNPNTIPLTHELCHVLIDQLNDIAEYSTRIYLRTQESGHMTLRSILQEGISRAFNKLKVASSVSISKSSTQPNISTSSNSSNIFSDDENMEQSIPLSLLQQYSDRLLKMVEQKMTKEKSNH